MTEGSVVTLSRTPSCDSCDSSNSDDSEKETDGTLCNYDEKDSGTVAIQDRIPIPTFGKISVSNSNDVHFGTKTVYQGPVTIKQFLYSNEVGSSDENRVHEKKETENHNGVENFGFLCDKDANNCVKNKLVVCSPDAIERPQGGYTRIRKGFIWLQNSPKQRQYAIAMFLTVIALSTAVICIVLLWKPTKKTKLESDNISSTDTNEQDSSVPIDYLSEIGNNTVQNKLRIVQRIQWLAQPPVKPINNLTVSPVPLVIIQHTATEACSSQAQCVFLVRTIQTYHMESYNFWDIGYNFLIGGDGAVYFGRGWTSEGAHTLGYNSKSIGIAFIGTFINEKPPTRQMVSCQKLIQMGVENGFIKQDYKLLAARQLSGTESPGLAFYEELKKWPHWSSTP